VSSKSFIIPKADKLKTFNQDSCDTFHVIDVNMWFKNNNLTPSSMNEIRQYIFEEWLHKKITSSKSKISSGSKLVIVYDSPTDPFINLLKHKIIEILEYDFCDIVLTEE
jgi:hypothetical protein